jgi:hypothetical protein
MKSEDYGIAYSEVISILHKIPREYYEKVPIELYRLFDENKKRGYYFEYDTEKTLDEQNVSQLAKNIIAILYEDYWDEIINDLKVCLIR